MIPEFRKKLSLDGRSLKWFHQTYLKNKFTYGYFIKQINDPQSIQKKLVKIINKFLKTVAV